MVSWVSRPSCVGMVPVRRLPPRSSFVRAVRLPICAGIVPLMKLEVRLLLLRSIFVTLLDVTVMPGHVFIFWLALVPHCRRRWLAGRLLLDALAVQWFRMATRARQSSTRSLLAPAILGLVVVFTKVPLVQPAADNRGMFLGAGGRVVVGRGGAVVGGAVHPYLTIPSGQGGKVVVGRVVGDGVLVRWQAMGL